MKKDYGIWWGRGKAAVVISNNKSGGGGGGGEGGHLIAIARRSSEKESLRIVRFSFHLGSCVEWRPPLMLWL